MKQQGINKVDFYQVIQRRRIGSLKEFFDREGVITQAQYYLWRSEAESTYTFSEKFEEELKKIVFKNSLEEAIIIEQQIQPEITVSEETPTEAATNKRISKKKVQSDEEPGKIEE